MSESMREGITRDQIKAGLDLIRAVAGAIQSAGEAPAGPLYSVLMGKMDLAGFDKIIGMLTGAKLVERRGDMLVWIGPAKPNPNAGVVQSYPRGRW